MLTMTLPDRSESPQNTPAQRRYLVACVAENRPDFATRVENLLLSRRALGGRLADAPFVVCVVDAVDPDVQARYEALGATVRVVPRLSLDAFNLANKLRMLELADGFEFDVLLALDCDTVVVGDPLDELPHDLSIGAAPADLNPLSGREWRRLFNALGLSMPERQVRATTNGSPMPPYFNSGVLAIARDQCAPLQQRWLDALEQVSRLWEQERPPIAPHKRFYSEQWALMRALHGCDVRALPTTMNFPTHVRIGAHAASHGEPRILHYHAQVSADGFVLRPAARQARPAVERFNAARAAALGIPLPERLRGSVLRREVDTMRRQLRRVVKSLTWSARQVLARKA